MSWLENIRPRPQRRSRLGQTSDDAPSSSVDTPELGSTFLQRIQHGVGRRRRQLVSRLTRTHSFPPSSSNQESTALPTMDNPIALAVGTTETQKVNSKSHRSEKKVECTICLNTFEQPISVSQLLRPCRCRRYVCTECIREFFMGAVRDPTRMPPRCCYIYPIHVALPHMSSEEAAAYRSRFEEWSAPEKIYCPVPTCSAFIPDRLTHPIESIDLSSLVTSSNDTAMPPVTKNAKETPNTTQNVNAETENRVFECFRCPKCDYPICFNCKQGAHPGEACKKGIAQETLKQIQKWGYKQCPSCKTGVKKMFGCNHMQCHCGSHWCWGCLKPINACEEREECLREDDDCYECEDCDQAIGGGEGGEGEQGHGTGTEENVGQDLDLQDLDDGLDFGHEPTEAPAGHAFLCWHEWEEMKANSSTQYLASSAAMECHRCWTNIVEAPSSSVRLGRHKSAPVEKSELERAWRCVVCGIMVCTPCRTLWKERRIDEDNEVVVGAAEEETD